MQRSKLPVLLLLATVLGYLAFPASGQDPSDPLPGDPDREFILSGTVTSATDEDGDGENDTFTIQTTSGGTKTVSQVDETPEMEQIEVDANVKVKVKVEGGELELTDVIEIS